MQRFLQWSRLWLVGCPLYQGISKRIHPLTLVTSKLSCSAFFKAAFLCSTRVLKLFSLTWLKEPVPHYYYSVSHLASSLQEPYSLLLSFILPTTQRMPSTLSTTYLRRDWKVRNLEAKSWFVTTVSFAQFKSLSWKTSGLWAWTSAHKGARRVQEEQNLRGNV